MYEHVFVSTKSVKTNEQFGAKKNTHTHTKWKHFMIWLMQETKFVVVVWNRIFIVIWMIYCRWKWHHKKEQKKNCSKYKTEHVCDILSFFCCSRQITHNCNKKISICEFVDNWSHFFVLVPSIDLLPWCTYLV